ncbi:hypothetical protein C8N43_2208 [Litoreibacter ponti]|uniref:Transferrin-binding protein B C-lobe/N-lobe beta barrel domain-containing protein n=1 Tax=Litoreibacter ponti TaxID=1510457 RepID=A0A2T6BN75_9RHOB|nr:hypothetical protein [Litoreibacter ponti]PTX57538.1 hypothetical protein C8N43_2208 [Litoreibacter ponti]
MTIRTLMTIGCVLGLSACGGGGGGGSTTGPVANAVFDATEAELVDKLIALNAASSNRAPGPISGSATYTGQVGVNLTGPSGDSNVVGDMVMTATFQGRDIDGSVNGLLSEDVATGDTARLGGTLQIDGTYTTNGVIDADLTGNIVIPDAGTLLNAAVDMNMSGEFLEVFDPFTGPGSSSPEGNAVAGTVTGDVTGDVLLTVIGGSFIGENTSRPGALSTP